MTLTQSPMLPLQQNFHTRVEVPGYVVVSKMEHPNIMLKVKCMTYHTVLTLPNSDLDSHLFFMRPGK